MIGRINGFIGVLCYGKTPVKHTLAGYIIKKQTPKDTGQEN